VTSRFRWSLRAYRGLLILYPDDLRRDFGPEILEAFAHDLSELGVFRVWRITLREAIHIALPACLRIPAVAVPALATAATIVTQSPLMILTVLRKEDATPLYALSAIAIGAALTAVTSFVAVYRWKRAERISLGLG
jgi:hypothetical protein